MTLQIDEHYYANEAHVKFLTPLYGKNIAELASDAVSAPDFDVNVLVFVVDLKLGKIRNAMREIAKEFKHDEARRRYWAVDRKINEGFKARKPLFLFAYKERVNTPPPEFNI